MNSNQRKLLEQLAELGEIKFIQKSKAGLIKAISNMDIASIDAILEEELTYQDISKKLFLEKLSEVFDEFLTEDDKLIPYEGKCNSEECPNKSSKGVSFVGNKSERYLNLIIEQSHDGAIKDIYHCSNFCPTAYQFDENKKNIRIRVYNDEKVNFYRSKDFNNKDLEAITAINEILHFENEIISKETLTLWKDKYEKLYNKLEWSILYKNLHAFSNCYFFVRNLCEYLEYENVAEIALEEYNDMSIQNEVLLLTWLVKYEELFGNLILLAVNTVSEKAIEIGKEKIHRDINVFFSVDLVKYCLSFYSKFNDLYYQKLDEYSTLTKEEKESDSYFNDNYSENSSLKYHLQKRGII